MFLFEPFLESIQKILFKAGIFLAVFVFLFAILFKNGITYKMPGCIFLDVTGIPCPACGGTRAFFALLNGDFWQSFLYNPVVLYWTIIYSLFMMSRFLHGFIKSVPSISLSAIHFLLVPVILLLNLTIRFACTLCPV